MSSNPKLDHYESGGGGSKTTKSTKGKKGKQGLDLERQLVGSRLPKGKVTPPLPEGSAFHSQNALGVSGRAGIEQAAAQARSRYGSYGYNSYGETKQLYYSKDLDTPASWARQAIMEWQLQMINAGLISPADKKKLKLGAWDNVSRKAYQQILENANRSGKTKEESLNDFIEGAAASAAAGLGAGAAQQPLTVSLSAPGELRESYRKSFNELTGHDPNPAALDAFVNSYHGLETQNQKTAYGMDAAGKGGTFTKLEDPGTVAQQQVQQQNAAEVQAYATIQRQNDFFSMLGPVA